MSDENEAPKRGWVFNVLATILALAVLGLLANVMMNKSPDDQQPQQTDNPSQPTNDDPSFRLGK